jgi:probable HAF family extracellular repeat protein
MRLIARASFSLLLLSGISAAADYRFVRVDFPNSTSSLVNTINARGDMVGNYTDADGNTHGFLLRKGKFSTIDFPGASFTAARSINARGDVAGRFEDAAGNDHGFLLSNGHFTQIDVPG